MTFRSQEKKRYTHLKTSLFSVEACQPGRYRQSIHPFCLAEGCAAENLYLSFRTEAMAYFRQRNIAWHGSRLDEFGHKSGLPSNHLCSSQVACVNFLYPMAQSAELATQVFSPFFPNLAEVLPFTEDGHLPNGQVPALAFEWIGTKNYLGEVGNRSRGANATSADFAFRFRQADGQIHMVLGEWKYTESYGKQIPRPDQINKTRLRIYKQAFDSWIAEQPNLPPYETFFVEPFYQLLRLTLLAREIERCGGDGHMEADTVSVLVIAPQANQDYRQNLAAVPTLAKLGDTVSTAWQNLAGQARFQSIATETLLPVIQGVGPASLQPWHNYLAQRYGW